MTPSFNLVDEPWIPCLLPNGDTKEVSLFKVLTQAHEIREIFDPSPMVVIALHRLLLAILHRNFGPESLAAWQELWQQGRWDEAKLGSYLDRWRHRFDLFHPERPFYQVTKMEKATEHPIQKLVEEAAWGNNPTLFDHNYRTRPIPMAPAEAARYLVAFQAFAFAGLAGPNQINFSDAPLTRGYSVLVLGDNLFETLALNLQTPQSWQEGNDAPCWEHDLPATYNPKGTHPCGLADYFSWQSRRVHLIRQGDGEVMNCQIMQNLKLPEGFHFDPFKCYGEDDKRSQFPLKIGPERALWRDSHTLFQRVSNLPRRKGSLRRPKIFDWLARIQKDLLGQEFRFSITGLASESGQAKVLLWRQERLPLPLSYLEDNPQLLSSLAKAISFAEDISRILNSNLFQTAQLILSPDYDPKTKQGRKPDLQNVRNLLKIWAPERLYFAQLEAPFRKLLVEMPEDRHEDEDGDLEYGRRTLPQWGRVLKDAALKSFEIVTAELGASPRALKAVAQVEDRFWRVLNAEIRKLSVGGEHEPEK